MICQLALAAFPSGTGEREQDTHTVFHGSHSRPQGIFNHFRLARQQTLCRIGVAKAAGV